MLGREGRDQNGYDREKPSFTPFAHALHDGAKLDQFPCKRKRFWFLLQPETGGQFTNGRYVHLS